MGLGETERCAEKAGATDGIQSAEEGGSTMVGKSVETILESFSKVFLFQRYFEDIFCRGLYKE